MPPRRVVGMIAGLVAKGCGLAEDPRPRPRAGLPLPEVIRGAQAADGRQRQHRGGQPDLKLAPPPFLDGPRLGHGPLALGGAELLLHAGQVGRDPAGHRPRVARPVGGLGGKAVAGQRDEVGVGPAGAEPGAGIGRVAAQGLAEDLVVVPPGVGGLAGEDLAEDRAEAEHVGPPIDPLDVAAGLLRRHVRRGAEHAAGLRFVLGRAAPHRPDHAHLDLGRRRLRSVPRRRRPPP